jgi:hypothetical protein
LPWKQSKRRLVHSSLDFKFWVNGEVPDVDVVRPKRCPCCGGPGRPLGEGLAMHGHGLRSRQMRGPPRPGFRPELVEVVTRRYQCQHCAAVVVVAPAAVLPRRYFSAAAIGWALALFGLARLSAAAVRKLVSPWRHVGATAARTWGSLRRWARAVRDRRLFPGVRPCPHSFTLRQVAAHAAQTLVGYAPAEHTALVLHDRAFFGAPQLVMGSSR